MVEPYDQITQAQQAQANPDPTEHLLDGLLAGLTPEQLAHFDALTAGPAPTMDTTQYAAPQQGLGSRIVQGFSGLEQSGQPQAQDFATALAQGFGRGLGSAGSRIAAQRAKLEADALQRTALRDQQNHAATALHQAMVNGGRQAYLRAGIAAAMQQGNEAPVAVQGPNGPVYVPRGQAVGQKPAEPQSATGEPLEIVRTPQGVRYVPRSKAAGMEPGSVDKVPVPTTGAEADQNFKEMGLQYIRTGNFPRNLVGKEDRDAFLAYVHANFPGTDIAKNAAIYKADQASFANQQKNYDTVSTLGNTLSTSMQTLRGAMNSVPDTGIPLGNAIARFGAKVLGNTAVPEYDQALHVVQNETGKILGGNFAGGGTLLESEKKDMKAVQQGSFTRDQLAHVMDIVESDKIGRLNAGRKQLNKVKARLDWAEAGTPTPQDTNWYGSINQEGKHFSVTDPDGKVHPFVTRGQANTFIESVNNANGY